jgi:hypothetical protein
MIRELFRLFLNCSILLFCLALLVAAATSEATILDRLVGYAIGKLLLDQIKLGDPQ